VPALSEGAPIFELEDLSENFSMIFGREADKLLNEARASSKD